MSFSSGVKEELALLNNQARHCRIALIAALFHLCPYITVEETYEKAGVRSDADDAADRNSGYRAGIRTESASAAQAFENALRRISSDPVEVSKKGRETTVWISGRDQVTTFLEMIKLDRVLPGGETNPGRLRNMAKDARISPVLLQKTCCRKAFLRGMFLAAGSVSDPSRSYHLEIAPLPDEDADRVLKLLSSVGFAAKCTRRKGRSVVYLKDGEQISDFLGAIGATGSLMKLENARILRDIAGNINRQVNFEAANLRKTGIASRRQMEDIALIERTVGISSLPASLQQAAMVRVENPDGSLQELAESCDPPVGRSGINHRLQRISEIAARIREDGTI